MTLKERFPVAVVRDVGEFVEVRTLSSREQVAHCGFVGADTGISGAWSPPGSPTLGGYDQRLFVRRQDMVPVLASQYADSTEDGSAVLLAAGTPVEPRVRSLGVRIGSRWFPTYTPPRDLRLSYDPEPIPEPEAGLRDQCDESAAGRLLGEEVSLEKVTRGWVHRCSIEQRDDDAGLRVILQDDCVRLEVAVDEDPRPKQGSGGGGTLDMGRGDVDTWTLPKDAKAFWRDGTPAGTKRTAQITTVAPPGRREPALLELRPRPRPVA